MEMKWTDGWYRVTTPQGLESAHIVKDGKVLIALTDWEVDDYVLIGFKFEPVVVRDLEQHDAWVDDMVRHRDEIVDLRAKLAEVSRYEPVADGTRFYDARGNYLVVDLKKKEVVIWEDKPDGVGIPARLPDGVCICREVEVEEEDQGPGFLGTLDWKGWKVDLHQEASKNRGASKSISSADQAKEMKGMIERLSEEAKQLPHGEKRSMWLHHLAVMWHMVEGVRID